MAVRKRHSRPRDKRGRFPKVERPDFEQLIASFGESWNAWRTLAIATQGDLSDSYRCLSTEIRGPEGGIPLSKDDGGNLNVRASNKFFNFELYRKCTGRQTIPSGPVKEVWAQVGRGGGKTRAAAAALVATAVREYPGLAPGERGKAFLLAQNRGTARQAFGYVRGILKSDPLLERMIINETKSTISLNNGVDIETVTASYRHVRGFSIVSAVADEVAFWWLDSDSANSDMEVLAALRPGLARVPGSVLWVISSPHVTRGALYEANKKYFGNDEADHVLFWQATTSEMNPTFDASEIERAFSEDSSSARVEYNSEFRKEAETYVSAEALDAAIETDRIVLPPSKSTRYQAFVDTAGGTGGDSSTLAIGHVEEHSDGEAPPTFVVDVVVERRPPFAPSETLKEFSALLKLYGVSKVVGDRYAGAFPAEAFAKSGVKFEPTAFSKSDLYKNVLPLITSGRVELLDKPRLRNQMLNLERRSRGGRETIDHVRGAHDDVANAVAGVLVYLSRKGVKNHGTRERSGHLIKVLWPSGNTYYCRGKDIHGRCISGLYQRPPKSNKDTYHLSDKLWAELEALEKGL